MIKMNKRTSIDSYRLLSGAILALAMILFILFECNSASAIPIYNFSAITCSPDITNPNLAIDKNYVTGWSNGDYLQTNCNATLVSNYSIDTIGIIRAWSGGTSPAGTISVQVYNYGSSSWANAGTFIIDGTTANSTISFSALTTDRIKLEVVGGNPNFNLIELEANSSVTGTGDSISVLLTQPSNLAQVTGSGANFTANYTVSGYNLTNATYMLWNSSISIFNQTTVSVTGNSTNSTTLFIDSFVLGTTYTWNVLACGVNNTGTKCVYALSNNTVYSSPFTDLTAIYNESVLETSNATLSLNISANPLVSSVVGSLWYNGSSHSSTVTNPNSGIYKASNTIDIPLAESDGNKTFWWEFTFTLTNGAKLIQNSTHYNQYVNKTYLVNCNGTFSTQFINFTTRNAANPFPLLNATFKSGWNWYVKGGSGTVIRSSSFENITELAHEFNFCMSHNVTFIVDSDIEYDASGYSQNFYYLSDAELTKSGNAINLYLLNDSASTLTVLKVRDAVQNPKPNVLIQIQLFDVGTNNYYTVGMAKTSFAGEDVTYLNWYNSLYKFILLENGTVIKNTDPYKIAETPQIFDVGEDLVFTFDKFRDFQYSLYFNNVTKNFVLTYVKPSGLVDQACLRVIKRGANNDTQLALTCETSSSGTIYYNIGSDGNGTFIATFYATGSLDIIDSIVESIGGSFSREIYDLLGKDDATFYAFLFAGVVTAMFFITPVLGILGVIVGLIGAMALGFAVFDYYVFIGIVAIGGLIIWIIKR